MPITRFAAAVLAVLVFGPAPCAVAAPEEDGISPTMSMIHDAVEATKHDPEALVFAVCLPESESETQRVFEAWSKASADLDDAVPVFFLTGADRDTVMDLASISRAPAFIAYRGGLPVHARTGCAQPDALNAFIELALDAQTAPSYSADQTRVLYDDMMSSLSAGDTRSGAEHGCMLMLTLHAFTDGPYASSFAPCERTRMDTMYNESLLRVVRAAREDSAAYAMLEQTARTAKRTWDKGRFGHLGIAMWIDLAEPIGRTRELLAWVDSSRTDERAAEALVLEGSRIRPLLIEHERWDALARSVSSPEQIARELDDAEAFARVIVADGLRRSPFVREHRAHMTRITALVHAALLHAGRDDDAWAVASILSERAATEPAAEALCRAAIDLGVASGRHTALAGVLDRSRHGALIDALPSATATVSGPLNDLVDD